MLSSVFSTLALFSTTYAYSLNDFLVGKQPVSKGLRLSFNNPSSAKLQKRDVEYVLTQSGNEYTISGLVDNDASVLFELNTADPTTWVSSSVSDDFSSLWTCSGTDFTVTDSLGNTASGTLCPSTLSFDNDVELENISVGLATSNDFSAEGMIGLGKDSDGSNSFIDTLYDQGYIDKKIASIYLHHIQMNGELGLGVINSTLYEGTLTYVDSVSGSLSGGWYVNLDGISDSSGNTISSSSGVALLDASSTVNYLPSSVIASISETLNGTYDSSLGLYQVNCHDISISKETLDFSFDNDVDISVPADNLYLTYDDKCYLSLYPSENDEIVLGEPFFVGAYVVLDYENSKVGFAQVDTDGTQVTKCSVCSNVRYTCVSCTDVTFVTSTVVTSTSTWYSSSTVVFSDSSSLSTLSTSNYTFSSTSSLSTSTALTNSLTTSPTSSSTTSSTSSLSTSLITSSTSSSTSSTSSSTSSTPSSTTSATTSSTTSSISSSSSSSTSLTTSSTTLSTISSISSSTTSSITSSATSSTTFPTPVVISSVTNSSSSTTSASTSSPSTSTLVTCSSTDSLGSCVISSSTSDSTTFTSPSSSCFLTNSTWRCSESTSATSSVTTETTSTSSSIPDTSYSTTSLTSNTCLLVDSTGGCLSSSTFSGTTPEQTTEEVPSSTSSTSSTVSSTSSILSPLDSTSSLVSNTFETTFVGNSSSTPSASSSVPLYTTCDYTDSNGEVQTGASMCSVAATKFTPNATSSITATVLVSTQECFDSRGSNTPCSVESTYYSIPSSSVLTTNTPEVTSSEVITASSFRNGTTTASLVTSLSQVSTESTVAAISTYSAGANNFAVSANAFKGVLYFIVLNILMW